ncbi:MAG TPA: hypothetical protein VGB30_06070 [bacterium]|jgi:hypothetical protein
MAVREWELNRPPACGGTEGGYAQLELRAPGLSAPEPIREDGADVHAFTERDFAKSSTKSTHIRS